MNATQTPLADIATILTDCGVAAEQVASLVRAVTAYAAMRSNIEAAVITLEKPWEEQKVELALVTLKAALAAGGDPPCL